jgi:hypothetical protein
VKRPTPRSPAAGPSATPPRRFYELAVVLLCVALALWTHRRVLGGFFSLDDLVMLEEMRGLRPHDVTLWRFLSGHAYFTLAVQVFGAHPFPYHVVNWVLHGANVAGVYMLVRRWGGGVAAGALAAGLFGTTRLTMTAVHSPASIGELAALGLTLGAFLVPGEGLRAGLGRGGLFAAALLCKESVALLPLVLLLPSPGSGPLAARLMRAGPPLALSAMLVLGLALSGGKATRLGGEAYATGLGANLATNLLHYAAWTGDLTEPIPDLAHPGPALPGLGIAVALGLIALAVVSARASRLPAMGSLWWLLGLAPVLPLLHHTYLHYLYVPLVGIGMAVGGALEWAVARGGRLARAPALSLTIALAAVLFHAVASDLLLERRATLRMQGAGVPLDPYLRKSEMARHASEAVASRLVDGRGRVAFLVPEGLEHVYSTAGEALDTVATGTHSYRMLEGALDGGRALRALHPGIDSVVFLPGWAPGYAAFELFGEKRDGSPFALGRGAEGYARAGAALLAADARQPASKLLAGALTEFPNHAGLRFQYARTFFFAGDTAETRRQLEELIRRAPNDPLAARVRADLSRGW